MDILNEHIWNTIQEYIDEDIEAIDNPGDIEKKLLKLKSDYPEYYHELKTLLQQKTSATDFFDQLGTTIPHPI